MADQLAFATPITFTGPARQPRQMLAEQSYGGHASVHDAETAGSLGLSGAPIEGPTHFSQFDPLAFARWGQRWFTDGCISVHFKTMVVEGDQVTASLTPTSATAATIHAVKADGAVVLTGSASVGTGDETELERRLAGNRDAGDLFIVDQLSVGQRCSAPDAMVDMETGNDVLYPFSLRQKLDAITEPSAWYDSSDNPWGRPILPFEMISVLTQKTGVDLPVRGPALGLFLDLEVRMVNGPLFVDQPYALAREVVALGQSRRTEAYWVRTTVTDPSTGQVVASVLLNSGVFKDSYADYPG